MFIAQKISFITPYLLALAVLAVLVTLEIGRYYSDVLLAASGTQPVPSWAGAAAEKFYYLGVPVTIWVTAGLGGFIFTGLAVEAAFLLFSTTEPAVGVAPGLGLVGAAAALQLPLRVYPRDHGFPRSGAALPRADEATTVQFVPEVEEPTLPSDAFRLPLSIVDKTDASLQACVN